MPSFDIVRTSQPTDSFRVQSIIGTYNLQQQHVTEHFTGNIELPDKWNIGLIVGRSGSGKTTIAHELFDADIISGFDWTHDNILDDMPKEATVKDIAAMLTAVGFSSPPSWLKPYAVLSNGEKMRCDIARAILEKRDMFVFDEFTSVVDRNVARVSSLAIQKAIRRQDKKFIATCNGDLCAFCAALPFPHPIKKNTWKGHRTVVLPDFQGVGIGTVFSDAIAELFNGEGKTFISTTSNPAMIHSRAKNPKWKTTHIGRLSSGVRTAKLKGSFSCNRLTVSFEYIGQTEVATFKK